MQHQPRTPAPENDSLIIFGLPLFADNDYVKALAIESRLAKKDGKHLVKVFPEKNGSKSARVTFTSIAAAREFMNRWHNQKPKMSTKNLKIDFWKDKNTSGSNTPKSPKEQIDTRSFGSPMPNYRSSTNSQPGTPEPENDSLIIFGLPLFADNDYVKALAIESHLAKKDGKHLVKVFPEKNGSKSARVTFTSIAAAREFMNRWHNQKPKMSTKNLKIDFWKDKNTSGSNTPKSPKEQIKECNIIIIKGLPENVLPFQIQNMAGQYIFGGKTNPPLITVFPPRNGFCSAQVIFRTILNAKQFINRYHKTTFPGHTNRLTVVYSNKNEKEPTYEANLVRQIRQAFAASSSSVLIKGLPENCNEDYLIAITKQKIKKGNKGKELVVIFPDHGSAKITFENNDEARKFIEEHHKKTLHGYKNKLTVEFYLEREDTKALSDPLVIDKQSNRTKTIVRNVVYVQGLNKRIEKEELLKIIEMTLGKAPATANIYRYSDGKSEGRGTISFKNAADAELCINRLNGRKANPNEVAWNMVLFKSENIRRLPNACGNEHLFGERTEGYAYDCLACFETYDERDMVGCSPIGHNRTDLETHFLCQDCVRRNCSAVVVDGQLGEHGTGLKCGETGCARVLLHAQVERALLDRSTADQLDKRMTKEALRDIEGIEYCKEENCNFGVILAQDPSLMQFFVCLNPACLSQFCRICKISFAQHVGRTCDDVDPERKIASEARRRNAVAEEIMTNSQTCVCPKCHTRYVKEQGCNHMTCTRCGAEFCYVCKQAIERGTLSIHYSQGRCNQTEATLLVNQRNLQNAMNQADMTSEMRQIVNNIHRTNF